MQQVKRKYNLWNFISYLITWYCILLRSSNWRSSERRSSNWRSSFIFYFCPSIKALFHLTLNADFETIKTLFSCNLWRRHFPCHGDGRELPADPGRREHSGTEPEQSDKFGSLKFFVHFFYSLHSPWCKNSTFPRTQLFLVSFLSKK